MMSGGDHVTGPRRLPSRKPPTRQLVMREVRRVIHCERGERIRLTPAQFEDAETLRPVPVFLGSFATCRRDAGHRQKRSVVVP